jgi:membrane-associated phospholipid phosphatase
MLMLRHTNFFLSGLLLAGSVTSVAQSQSTFAEPVLDLRNAFNHQEIGTAPKFADKSYERSSFPSQTDFQSRLGWPFMKRLVLDQKAFWTSGKDIGHQGAIPSLSFAAITGALIAGDDWISQQVPDSARQLKRSRDLSQFSTFSLAGAAGAALVWGHVTRNDHLRETGLLSAETAINSTAVAFALKNVTQRPRPLPRDGNFLSTGGSFPSAHSALAWSVASVVAHEYPGPLTKFLAYGSASAVTVTRLTSKEHFASDVIVGSALGWYMGRQTYRRHHDPELGGGPWGSVEFKSAEPRPRSENMGSPYVAVDSWVYPIFDRLSALGYAQTGYAGLRPWTRLECARLLEEAGERFVDGTKLDQEGRRLYQALAVEFQDESTRLDGAANLGLSVDSIYSRVTQISGRPLRDGYHFEQTIINDNGRPYAEGFNSITGMSGHAVAGPLSFDFRAEYQHAPTLASDPFNMLETIAKQDGTPTLANGIPATNRFRLLNSTVGVTYRGIQFSFGKQSLWLGPGAGGPFLFSNNAEGVPMLRIEQSSPIHIPGLSRLLGPMRSEFFLGQLSGHHWVLSKDTFFGPNNVAQPYIHGEKISFKPTANLEFGMGITSLFGGPDLPFTWGNFLRSLYVNAAPGSPADPGDRRSTFEFSYRVPYLRNWLTIYADSLVDDEFSPLGSTRPSMRMGMYLPRLPKVPKLDLRLEGVYTDVPGQQPTGFVYFNARYRGGYTNNGSLLGSWIGREGRGGQAWSTYWFSPRSQLQLSYRHAENDREFIGGGRLNDFGVKTEFMLRSDVAVSGSLQYERWNFPVLSPKAQSNLAASFQCTFYPHWKLQR